MTRNSGVSFLVRNDIIIRIDPLVAEHGLPQDVHWLVDQYFLEADPAMLIFASLKILEMP